MGNVPGLIEVIKLLASGVGVGAVLAFLFEKFGFFKNLDSSTKWWVVFLTSVALPVLAQVALQFVPAEIWATLQPYWYSLAAGFLAWAGSQVAHRFVNNRR